MVSRYGGFTIVELVITLMVVGILAAITIPRFTSTSDFDVRGYYDSVANALRYAHKIAIAQRRTVYVKLDTATGQVSLCFANSFPCSSAADQVPTSLGEKPYVVSAPSGASLSYSPALASDTFYISSLGKPYRSSDPLPSDTSSTSSFLTTTITIAGDGTTRTIVVEKESGYVRT